MMHRSSIPKLVRPLNVICARTLLAKGEKPVCVTGCPMRILDQGNIDELKKKYQGVSHVKGMPEPKTKLSLIIKPHCSAVMNCKKGE